MTGWLQQQRSLFGIAAAGMLLFGVTLITLGSVAIDLQQKFSLDAAGAGTLFTLLPFGLLAGSFIFGPLADRFGYRWLLILSCIGMFAGFQGIAHAPELRVLHAAVFLFGLAGGMVNGATNALVADISPEQKGANLSLLGVFFGLGALIMPLVLAFIKKWMAPLEIVAAAGWLPLMLAVICTLLRFPAPKAAALDMTRWKPLMNALLLLIAGFLFFQSSLEAIINNWSVQYLLDTHHIPRDTALYALSVHIGGMILFRVLMGSWFRQLEPLKLLWVCLALLMLGVALMQWGGNIMTLMAGLLLSGAGLAGGFPLMLGIAGTHFSGQSATAFSVIFTISIAGNMLLNYITGLVIRYYGIQQLTTVCYLGVALMALLLWRVQLQTNKK